MSLKGTIEVDQFPSAEAYIKDPNGRAVFIGVNPCKGGPLDIWIGSKKKITFDFKILTYSDGSFKEVEEGYRTYSIDNWNSRFENQNASKY